jgi:uncharacterized protein (DUF488 family)
MKTASFITTQGEGRISIARYAPRGTPKGFRMFKALAPGSWFNSVTKDVYVERYTAEVLGALDPQKTFDELTALAAGAEPVLLCWEKPTDKDTYCHRSMVADWFRDKLGVEVPELGYEGQPHPLAA